MRGATVLGSSLFFITGLSFLPIAEASATGFVAPMFVTALSIVFLNEVVGLRRWIATGVGLLGVCHHPAARHVGVSCRRILPAGLGAVLGVHADHDRVC
jgi:EamA domain-containing membrane protein RarD